MITYDQFKAKYPPGSSVANPEGAFLGQCVSYVRQYMAQVHGVVTDPLGNAVDFATNPTFLKYYDKVSTPQVGDIMIWGDDVGTWTGPAGHDAIYDGTGYMWNQNYNGSRVVSINKIFTPGFIGYYRLKGGGMNASQTPVDPTTVKLEYNNGLLRNANDGEVKSWVDRGVSVETFQRAVQASGEHITVLENFQIGVEVKRILGVGQINAKDVDAALKAHYGSNSNCTVEERAYLDAMYKLNGGK